MSKLNNIEVTGEHKQLLITDASGKLTLWVKNSMPEDWDVDPHCLKVMLWGFRPTTGI
ncbi:MAG: hypothetical protein ACLRXQ_12860 [Phascolarctobacterium faecium]